MNAITKWMLPLVGLAPAVMSTTQPCNACTFWEGYDQPNCKVYGQLHTGGLIAYERASEKCLDYYNVHVETVDPEDVENVFPNPDGTNGNLELFIELLREDMDSTSGAIYDMKRIDMDHFFEEVDPEIPNGLLKFKDRLKLGVTVYDCTARNGNDCWTLMREYFAQPNNSGEVEIYGNKLWRAIQRDNELEQQSVRVQICDDRSPSESICGGLVTQILQMWRDSSQRDCNLYGLGPEGYQGHLHADCVLDAGGGWRPEHLTQADKTSGADRGARFVDPFLFLMVLGWLAVVLH